MIPMERKWECFGVKTDVKNVEEVLVSAMWEIKVGEKSMAWAEGVGEG